jgi:predicted metal-binding membrane protein
MDRPQTVAPTPWPARAATLVAAIALACWAFVAWTALDMSTPLAELMMPASDDWTGANVAAVALMWAVMMAAMMLPSAWPMVRTFAAMATGPGGAGRLGAFVAAYVVAWGAFSAVAVVVQWALQRAGWVDPMIVSTSAPLTAVLLAIAGLYQFSPLKRRCLAGCRTPMGFLLGEWRPGARGAWTMGLRHGALCVGCCWALMALLFVGGAMNLPWIAALSVLVAVEKLAPGGERLALALGILLLAAGTVKLALLLG